LSQFYFLKDKIKILDDFKDDESIIIVKPDKKNGVVILDKNDYNSKMEDILQDTMKFEHLMDARKPTQKITDNVKRNLNQSHRQVTNNCFLLAQGSAFYTDFRKSTRTIFLFIENYSYKDAKFFIPLLNPISSGAYMVKDSFSLVQELLSLNLNSSNIVMASFDVTFLFTNIPLDETN
jgi:PHD/YefM family antitoxin component YafN of YafNO toxin-antitoxin module